MDELPNIFHLVIPSFDGKLLLVRRSGRTISLPLVAPPKDDDSSPWVLAWDACADDLCTVISTALGIDAYVVTILWDRNPDPPVFTEVVVQVEPLHYTFELSDGLAWLDRAAVLTADWQSLHKDLSVPLLLTTFFTRMDGGAPAIPSPWRTAGWFLDTESWALSVIKQHGMHVVGRLKQRRNMHHSTVLSCEVKELRVDGIVLGNWRSSNSIYIKATHPSVPEAKMTLTVSSTMEEFVPKILAIDESRNAMIQLGAQAMNNADPEAVMEMLANLHIASIQHIDALKAGGVPDRGLAWLSSCISDMFFDPILERCEEKESLRSLRRRVREVQCICKRLLDYNIPDTLVHGDCDESNICCGMHPDYAFSLIDWATCCIGHPFFDLARLTMENEWGDNKYNSASESYFKNWISLTCPQRMAEAFPLVWPLLFCYNLNILLSMFKMVEPVEQPSMLRLIEDRLMDIVEALDKIPGNESSSWDREGYQPNIYHFVVPNATGDKILTRRSGCNMSLPLLSPPKINNSVLVKNWDKDIYELHSVLKAEMGLDAYPLRPLWIRLDIRNGIEEVVLMLELLGKMSKAPDNLEWISRKDALMGEWEEIGPSVDLKGLLAKFFNEMSSGDVPEGRVPWRSVGWLQETMNWIAAVLSKIHMELAKSIDIVRNTSHSCVLRCTTRQRNTMMGTTSSEDSEVFYVKTVHPNLSVVKMMAVLPSTSRGIVPAVVAIDESRNTYMQRDAGSQNGSNLNTELLMKTLGDVQIRSIDHLDTLKDAGVPVFNTEWLHSCIATIMNYPLLDLCGKTEMVAKLRAEIPRLERCCQELLSFSFPETLVHGDFHPGNVGKLVADSHYHIFDWSAAFIGHPFCDFAVMRFSVENPEIDQELAENTYFGVWKKYGSADALRKVSQLALILYFCLNLYRLQKLYEVVESIEHGSIVTLCKESMGYILYGLRTGVARRYIP